MSIADPHVADEAIAGEAYTVAMAATEWTDLSSMPKRYCISSSTSCI